MPGDLNLL